MNTPGRTRIYSGTPFERQVGYARATRSGQHIFVSGTTAMREGQLVGPGDAAAQTTQILANIGHALERAEASLHDVVRYRIYVTNIDDWSVIAPVLADAFDNIHPSATLVAVSALIDPAMLVEIEADAIVGSAQPIDRFAG